LDFAPLPVNFVPSSPAFCSTSRFFVSSFTREKKSTANEATTVFWYQLIASSAILAVSGLVEFSTRSRIAMLLNSESMVVSFRQMLSQL
jgi:N-acyl-L-homoserine lactone synthetase